ncbi:MAG: hypothetical protein C3L24_09210, partial [Candidatus Sedimenticola endophacoides]
MNLIQQFYRQAERDPDKVALLFGARRLRYREVVSEVARLAALLEAMGVRRGARVALLLENSIEFTLMLLAGAELGALLVPLNTGAPPAQTHRLLTSSRAAFLVAGHAVLGQLLEAVADLSVARGQILSVGAGRVGGCRHYPGPDEKPGIVPAALGARPVDVDSDYLVTMTSGSTGEPKSIVFSQRIKLARVSLPRERFWDIPVPKIDSPTRQPLLPRPSCAHHDSVPHIA